MYDTPLIFYGPNYESSLKKENHPDYFEIQPEGKNYTKEQIVDFLSDVALSPYEGAHKVYLFQRGDKMLPVHANALLKTFEEKPNHAVILLVVENIKTVLETILSRSKKIFVSAKEDEKASSLQEKVKKMILQGAKGDLYSLMDEIVQMEEVDLEELFAMTLEGYRDLHLLKHKISHSSLDDKESEALFSNLNKLPSLEQIKELISLSRMAHLRHTKPRQVLEYLFLKPLFLNSRTT